VAAVEASPAPVQPTLAQVQSPTTEAPPEPEPKPAVQTDPARPGLYLQVGAFGDPANAERLRKRLTAQLAEGVKVQASASEGPTLYKVRVGPLGSEQEAAPLVAKLGSLGVTEPRRVWN
jgi:rare lipoprotein A